MGDKTPSPPSSPPEAAATSMPTTTRKRSHEETNRKVNEVPASSSTVVPDVEYITATNTQGNKEDSNSSVSKSSAQSKPMGPPPLPSNAASQKPPRSGQGSVASIQTSQAIETTAKKEATLSAPTKRHDAVGSRSLGGEDGVDNDVEQTDSPMSDSEPQDQIEIFNWRDLQERYHTRMEELNAQEENIMNEFNGLCDESLLAFAVEL
jgi:hypothetical protein